MYRLRLDTPRSWAEGMVGHTDALLADHAHCELKATSAVMSVMRKGASVPGLPLRLAPLVKEEADHLHRVLREMEARGVPLGPDRPNPYVRELSRAAGELLGDQPFLRHLLVSALVEMRSHERFEALLACDGLAEFHALHGALAEAESRHGAVFVGLAREQFGEERVAAAFDKLARAEARVLAGLPFEVRVHSGAPG